MRCPTNGVGATLAARLRYDDVFLGALQGGVAKGTGGATLPAVAAQYTHPGVEVIVVHRRRQAKPKAIYTAWVQASNVCVGNGYPHPPRTHIVSRIRS